MLARAASRALRTQSAPVLTASKAVAATGSRVQQEEKTAFGFGTLLALGGATVAATSSVALCSDDHIPPPQYPWSHGGPLSAFDAASVRRGYQVYKEVCASCHSMNRIAFRNLVGVAFTEAEAKAMAAEEEVKDGPNDEGEMFTRPGKLSDYLPAPYENEAAARAANEGAYPPDLSLIVKARPGGADYVFSLLTGYRDAPAGVEVPEGKHWNPYFAGGAIGMAQQIYEDQVEYDDGTEPTITQVAKDVTTFLAWASEPENDERKKMGMKWVVAFSAMAVMTLWYKNYRWSVQKYRKLYFR